MSCTLSSAAISSSHKERFIESEQRMKEMILFKIEKECSDTEGKI